MQSGFSHNEMLLREMVVRDRLAFLKGLNESALASGTFLDLQHQTLFRILSEMNGGISSEVLDHYIENPDFRRGVYDKVYEYCLKGLTSTPDISYRNIDAQKIAGGYSYSSSLAEEIERLSSLFNRVSIDNPNAVIIRSTLGFAYFPSEHIHFNDALNIAEINDSRLASVGAQMYYGFNVSSGQPSFLQTQPIKVLAQSLAAHVRNASSLQSQYSLGHKLILKEMSTYAEENDSWESDIADDVKTFLTGHELGHVPDYEGNKLLFSALQEAGISAEEFYKIGFPIQDDLNAWSRIKDGKGKPRDVLFLLGDYLANMALLCEGIDSNKIRPLRAFNWWLAKKPTDSSRPRGLTNFLADSYSFNQEAFVNGLRDIFYTSVRRPHEIRQKLDDFEKQGWKKLMAISQEFGVSLEA